MPMIEVIHGLNMILLLTKDNLDAITSKYQICQQQRKKLCLQYSIVVTCHHSGGKLTT